MMTRTLKQVKMFDVKAKGQTLISHGYYEKIPGITWVEKRIWESDAECERCLNEAIKDWNERHKKNGWDTTDKEPEVIVYWETIEINENNA